MPNPDDISGEDFGDETPIVPHEPILQFFAYTHLPETLQAVSKPFCTLAVETVLRLPRNPERSECLRKLLEAKDCAVRAYIYKQES